MDKAEKGLVVGLVRGTDQTFTTTNQSSVSLLYYLRRQNNFFQQVCLFSINLLLIPKVNHEVYFSGLEGD